MTRDVATVLAALADPTRRALVDLLTEHGPASASELQAWMPISRQGVAKHLRVLADAAVVVETRDGRHVRYRVDVDAVRDAGDWLRRRADEWNQALSSLKRAAES